MNPRHLRGCAQLPAEFCPACRQLQNAATLAAARPITDAEFAEIADRAHVAGTDCPCRRCRKARR